MRKHLFFNPPRLTLLAILATTTVTVFWTPLPVSAQRDNDRTRKHFHGDHPHPRDPRHVPPKHRPDVTIERFRSIDGSDNNRAHPNWGTPGNHLRRISPPVYADGIGEPAGGDRRIAREVSNLVFDQAESILNRRRMSSMVWQWGQFLDHDIDLTEAADPLESWPIQVPTGDIFFDPFSTGTAEIGFFRSEYGITTGVTRPRQQVNFITAWMDGSNVYGSDDETANELRAFQGGLMKTSAGDLLPLGDDGLFMAGDIRANEQTGLTAMHTLFAREHNRVARRYAILKPHLTDEQIYVRARRLTIGVMQAITVNEFLPALMGPQPLKPYRGYRPDVSPKIINCFSTAAYRLGHSMLPTELERLSNDGQPLEGGPVALREAFFNPTLILADGIEPYLMGLCNQQCQELDAKIVDDVRNFLFGPPGAGGFDLASLNIQRGRDHGLPDYNTLRVAAGLPAVRSFSDITADVDLQISLAEAYDFDVNNIDAWVGMLSEDHVNGGSVGPSIFAILATQFEALRDGDRFWYEKNMSSSEIQRMNRTRLSDIIRRNTTITVDDIEKDVFILPRGN